MNHDAAWVIQIDSWAELIRQTHLQASQGPQTLKGLLVPSYPSHLLQLG